MNADILNIRNLSKSYAGTHRTVSVLLDVSLRIQGGQFVVVRGPSGCGKTTLLLSAAGLLRPDGGEIRIDAQDPYGLDPDRRARFRAANIGFVFQQFHLIPFLNVLDNVLAPALADGSNPSHRRARELIERFGLGDRGEHLPGELSTGERQRTALARAMLNEPKLILADEPTGNLDEENSRTVFEALGEFASAGGAVLLVTHQSTAPPHAQRVLRLEGGALHEM